MGGRVVGGLRPDDGDDLGPGWYHRTTTASTPRANAVSPTRRATRPDPPTRPTGTMDARSTAGRDQRRRVRLPDIAGKAEHLRLPKMPLRGVLRQNHDRRARRSSFGSPPDQRDGIPSPTSMRTRRQSKPSAHPTRRCSSTQIDGAGRSSPKRTRSCDPRSAPSRSTSSSCACATRATSNLTPTRLSYQETIEEHDASPQMRFADSPEIGMPPPAGRVSDEVLSANQ
jgi:hypothetical protein